MSYGDILLQASAWGFLLCVGLWVIGLVSTWWGKFKLVYFGPIAALFICLLALTAVFLPHEAFEEGRGEWLFGTTLLSGIAAAVALGMFFVSALAHGVFLLRNRQQNESGVSE